MSTALSSEVLNARQLLGSHDVVFIVLDTLRYDVAQACLAKGETPNLETVLPGGVWQQRHSPGNFTYAAHQAFFGGFLPTPIAPGKHPRLFALDFPGSETTTAETCVFQAPTIVHGFAQAGYHTLCLGGVGFFNKSSPLGSVLPGFFQESHWSPEFSVTARDSTKNQVALARLRLQEIPAEQRVFLFVNVSALHQPNYFYLEGARSDSVESHAAALRYVDSQLGPLFSALQQRASTLCIICSDHGTAYGEQGYSGHRIAHPAVWNVPYAEFVLE